MSKYLRLLFPLVLLASPLLAQRGTMAIPAEAQMDRYPLHSAVLMTAGEMAKLQLHPVVLVEATQVLNYYRNINRFVLEVLPVGTVVLSDSLGVPRYKADCVNRLVLPTKCPVCLGLAGGNKLDSTSVAKARADSIRKANALLGSVPGFWSRVGSNFGSLMDATKSVLSWLLPLLLWLVLIGLVLLGLWWLYNQIRNGGSGRTPPMTPRPIVAPPAPVVGPTPPAPTPTPVPPVVVSPVSPHVPTPVPTTQASALVVGSKTFVHFAHADGRDPHMLRYSDDIRSITHESEGGVNTIRFRV